MYLAATQSGVARRLPEAAQQRLVGADSQARRWRETFSLGEAGEEALAWGCFGRSVVYSPAHSALLWQRNFPVRPQFSSRKPLEGWQNVARHPHGKAVGKRHFLGPLASRARKRKGALSGGRACCQWIRQTMGRGWSCRATPVEVRSATRFVSEDRPGVQKPGLCDGWLGPAVRAGALQGGMPARCGCSQPPGAPGRGGGGSRTCGKGIAAAAALAYGVAGCASSSIG